MPSTSSVATMRRPETKRQRCEVLRAELELEQASFMADWREVGEFLLPRRPRFDPTDVNRGGRRNHKIIDSTASLAIRTLRSGMTSYVTSPARPWFKLTTPDPSLAEIGAVKRWLSTVTQRLSDIFLKSNLYNSLPIAYGDMSVFGTSAILIEEDFKEVIHTYVFPIGSYMIAADERGTVNVFFRRYRMTVRNLISKFGVKNESTGQPNWGNFSDYVKGCYENGHLGSWVDVCHVIQPNEDYDPTKLLSKYKRFTSSYYETGSSGPYGKGYSAADAVNEKFLRESGYDHFPVLCPRWEVNSEDSYGTNCPGFEAVGDVKQLQSEQKRKSQGIEKIVNPAMVAPTSMRTTKASIIAGDITYTDEREGTKGFRPAHDVKIDLQHLLLDIQAVQKIISRVFYEDLFLMMVSTDRREITATEIEARREEKLSALGPVMDQLNKDLLDPLIDITYMIAERQSRPLWGTENESRAIIPPPPDELMDMDLKVEYISVMAQAQKLVGIAGIERLTNFVTNYTGQTKDTTMLRKFRADQAVDIYADRLGVDPSIIRTDEEVAEIEAAQNQAQQQMQMAEMVDKGAGSAQKIAKAASLFAETQKGA